MKKQNKATWLWGIFFLLAAGLVIASQIGLLPNLSWVRLTISIFMLAIIVGSIPYMEFFGMLVPLAVILALFSHQLNIRFISPWAMVGSAVLASIGLSLLFKDKRRQLREQHYGPHCDKYGNYGEWVDGEVNPHHETVEDLNENVTTSRVTFGASVKYLHADSLERAEFVCTFGSMKIYFDQAHLSPNGADVTIHSTFSGVTLYVPSIWTVREDIVASLGSVRSRENRSAQEDQQLRLHGTSQFGSIDIVYV